MTEDDWREIETAVAAYDPDRHVATFFAPKARRRALTTLYAFDLELARIGLTIREPMAGHVRLAWWREQLGAIFEGKPPQSPIAQALAEVVATHKLPREPFDRTIDARAHDLDEAPFADEAALEAHADATNGTIMRLGLQVLEPTTSAEDAIRNAAIASNYATTLRQLSRAAQLRRCQIPQPWLAAENLNTEDVFAGLPAPALERLKTKAATRIAEALAAANKARYRLAAMPILSPATLARLADPTPRQRVLRLAFANLAWRL